MRGIDFAFYTPGERNIHDVAAAGPDGTIRGRWSGLTLAEYREREKSPSIVMLPFDEACKACDDAARAYYCKPAAETDRDYFWQMLEVLPPCKWTRLHGEESFHVSERHTGDLVRWCVSLTIAGTERYFTFIDESTIGHARAVAKVRADCGV